MAFKSCCCESHHSKHDERALLDNNNDVNVVCQTECSKIDGKMISSKVIVVPSAISVMQIVPMQMILGKYHKVLPSQKTTILVKKHKIYWFKVRYILVLRDKVSSMKQSKWTCTGSPYFISNWLPLDFAPKILNHLVAGHKTWSEVRQATQRFLEAANQHMY